MGKRIARPPAVLLVATLAMLSVVRAALLVAYPELFASLGAGDRAIAFFRGLRFDVSITCAVAGIPTLMLLAPIRARAWRIAWGWVGFVAVTMLALVAIGDAIYFGLVQRHAGPEAAALAGEMPQLARLVVADHAMALAFFVACVAAAAWIWSRILRDEPRTASRRAWLLAVATIPIAVIGIRGGLQGKPMGSVNAFDGVSHAGGLLALSGPFAIAQGFVALRPVPSHFMPEAKAIASTHRFLASPKEHFLSDDRPLLRRRDAGPRAGSPPNVVVVLLEGWSTTAVDVYRGDRGLPPRGLTPIFDELSPHGLRFTNFHANGQRSAESFSAILAGIPALPGIQYLGLGMEQNSMPYLGRLAKQNGVRSTLFVRGALRDSFHLDAISSLAGFDRYLGFEDIDAREHRGRDHPWGASDERTFARAQEEISALPEPFLAFLFTLSTHPPFPSPGGTWDVLARDTDEQRYENSVHYADAQLGTFLAAARASGWYDRTIFVFVSDHYPPLADRSSIDVAARHHIPMLIVAPGLAPGTNASLGSHLDLLPTIMELAGWSGDYASIGRSLLERDEASAAAGPLVTGDLVTWIGARGSVTHDLRKRVSATGTAEDTAAMEEQMLALIQVTLHGLSANRIGEASPGH